MTPRTKKTAAAVTGALVLASGAYALGTQTGDGNALAGGKPTPANAAAPGPGPRFGELVRHMAGRARDYYERSVPLVVRVEPRSRPALRAMSGMPARAGHAGLRRGGSR